MRLFIAIEFPAMIRDNIREWMQVVSREIPDPDRRLHWVTTEQLHITLKFLGETREDQIPRLHQALQSTIKDHSSFSLRLAKIGHFGGRVVWLGVDSGADALNPLARSITDTCNNVGFTEENRHFQPHVTLARSKKNPGAIRLADLPPALTQIVFGPFKVDHISLIQSTLTPTGAVYRTLERLSLRG